MSHRLAVQRKFPERSRDKSRVRLTTIEAQKHDIKSSSIVANESGSSIEQSISLRTRILQMLALKPMGQAQIAMAVKKPKDELIRTLNQVGTVSGGIWSLKPELYSEVQIDGWRLYTTEQRATVLLNVQEALGNEPSDERSHTGSSLKQEAHISVDSNQAQAPSVDTYKRKAESPILVDDEPAPVQNPLFVVPDGMKHRSTARPNELQRNTKICRNTATPLKKARVVKETSSIYNMKIPKRSLLVREKTASIRKSKGFRIPAVKTASDYQDLTALFRVKYSSYIRLNEKLSKRRPIFEKLNEQLQTAIGTPQESELKRKIDMELAKHNANEVTKWAKQYCNLHQELEAIKKELWRAYEEGCMN
ncbi:hypothetical protein K493DRAFT_317566 [Basidiobolus meristosporus CBS 931.73]|uniref:RNA polymerase II elongation factor ELL N-terminal domain-containing protein n=1 Tax=Basidiobolus meristosporus CBS 931.73 TaxID=1314790 RepID=A0A1Y1XZ86_9FUNG|nr:hypothetical protein K493DRAFT_317566 [Basidiobolus meristosporus CBS 931.73]|eukprot:ORX91048.1 hypothetical protein K493DRAFT_317566 [Basidiobolus meristosporus CBS 931.73]